MVNYTLPINKIPFLSFVNSNYTYTGDYSWQRASLAMQEVESGGTTYNLGNTIQNAASHRLNTKFTMETLYKYLGLTKGKKPTPKPTAAPKPGEKVVAVKPQVQKERGVFMDGLIGVLTSVKNITIDYTENKGTILPGYTPGIGFFGTAKPTLGFTFGSQDDVRFLAAQNGWLTNYQDFNQNFSQVTNKSLNFNAEMILFPDFTVNLTGNRIYADNFSEQYDVSPDGTYNSRSPYNTGNFAISTVMLKSAFKQSDENYSSAFNDFRGNRIIVADRLATQYYGNTSFARDAEGYPVGFGKNSQAVLIPSLLSAYTGLYTFGANDSAKDISLKAFRNIPIPNWTIKYTGLMRYKFFKDNFKKFSINHGYKAMYTINSFRSNFEYDQNPTGLDTGGNINNKLIIGNINLEEHFSPLVKVDFELKNSFRFNAEMKKDRVLSMSFDNNLLTEVNGLEYIVGLGYRIKDVILNSQYADNSQGIIKSDINMKVDFSYRNNKTIVRYLDYDNNQLGGGQNIWSAKLTADYAFSKNLTAIFFYDHSFSKAVISTSFPLTNIRSGFTLRYNFGN